MHHIKNQTGEQLVHLLPFALAFTPFALLLWSHRALCSLSRSHAHTIFMLIVGKDELATKALPSIEKKKIKQSYRQLFAGHKCKLS